MNLERLPQVDRCRHRSRCGAKIRSGTSRNRFGRGCRYDRCICRENLIRTGSCGWNLVLAGPGEPLGAFAAAYLAIEIGILISGKTKLDIILTPLVCIGTGSAVGLFVGPPISEFMLWLGSLINWGTEQQPFLMGNCRFRFNGNDPDASDQLSGAWSNPESVGTGGRGGDDRMLL